MDKKLGIKENIRNFYHAGYKISASVALQRRAQNLLGLLLTPSKDMVFTSFPIRGLPCLLTESAGSGDTDVTLLYCHGGGYTTGDLQYCRILSAKLAKYTGFPVLSFAYPLAPEHTYPTQLRSACLIYRHLLKEKKRILLVGESAGGHLALTLMFKLKEKRQPLPEKLVLLSPVTDFTLSGETYRTNQKTDILISHSYIQDIRGKFAPDMDYASPWLSPLNGDFSGFPPTLIQAGSHEVLLSDATRLWAYMRRDGTDAAIQVFKGMGHVFQMYPEALSPQIEKAMEGIVRILRDN